MLAGAPAPVSAVGDEGDREKPVGSGGGEEAEGPAERIPAESVGSRAGMISLCCGDGGSGGGDPGPNKEERELAPPPPPPPMPSPP